MNHARTVPCYFDYDDHPTRSGSGQLSVRSRLGVAHATMEFGTLMSTCVDRGLTVRRLAGPLPGPRALIFDQTAVLLFFPEPVAGRATFQVLVIRHPEMVALMEYAFESLWGQKQATELDAEGHSR